LPYLKFKNAASLKNLRLYKTLTRFSRSHQSVELASATLFTRLPSRSAAEIPECCYLACPGMLLAGGLEQGSVVATLVLLSGVYLFGSSVGDTSLLLNSPFSLLPLNSAIPIPHSAIRTTQSAIRNPQSAIEMLDFIPLLNNNGHTNFNAVRSRNG
jgi:hypothetical protein